MQPAHAALVPTAVTEATRLRQLTANDLDRVNAVILQYVQSDIGLIRELASHVIAAGGKRLRPCLTIAAAQLCGYGDTRHIHLAACVEFIHTATLLHDDVVDASHLRRGEATANVLWGNKSSVLVGDFLLSRAFQLMVVDGSLDVLKILSDAAAIISAGEVQQLMVSHDLALTQEIYLEVLSAKTAALFAAACELGAVVADKPHWRAALRRYGEALGLAFQLVDDALDYQSSEASLGKAIGDDFRDGKVTLPVLIAYEAASTEEKKFWSEALEGGDAIGPEELKRAKQLLLKTGAFDKTMTLARHYAAIAREALAEFPDNEAKQAMLEAADFAVERSH